MDSSSPRHTLPTEFGGRLYSRSASRHEKKISSSSPMQITILCFPGLSLRFPHCTPLSAHLRLYMLLSNLSMLFIWSTVSCRRLSPMKKVCITIWCLLNRTWFPSVSVNILEISYLSPYSWSLPTGFTFMPWVSRIQWSRLYLWYAVAMYWLLL